MLSQRLTFGSIMIAAMLGLFYLDNRLDQVSIAGTVWQDVFNGRDHLPAGLPLLAVFLTLIVLGARELARIVAAKGQEPHLGLLTLAGVSGCLLMFALPQKTDARTTMAIFASLFVLLFIATLLRHSWMRHRTEGAVMAAALTSFALIYMGLLPGFLCAIRRWHSGWLVLGLILVVKSCDIGAYFTGRFLGRHKLIPWLSPGKTWEGLAGGMIFAGLVAAGLAWVSNHFGIVGSYDWEDGRRTFAPETFCIPACGVAGLLLGLLGQFGDLVASLFKRDAGIKDSGSSIPGFGGVLDVVDSPIVVAPFAYWLLWSGLLVVA